MAVGSISVEQFISDLTEFLEISASTKDTWYTEHVKNNRDNKFLVKKMTRCITLQNMDNADTSDETGVDQADLEADSATLDVGVDTERGINSEKSAVSTWVYNIIYSPSYGVPVLYFNAHWQDGRLFSLEEVWQSVPVYYQERLQHERWSFITQQEHPLLQRPFFQLHPCHTSSMMKQIRGTNPSKSNYLLTWLSSVGPVVHLDVPISYLSKATTIPDDESNTSTS